MTPNVYADTPCAYYTAVTLWRCDVQGEGLAKAMSSIEQEGTSLTDQSSGEKLEQMDMVGQEGGVD